MSETICPDCGGPTGASTHVEGCCVECVGKRLLALADAADEQEALSNFDRAYAEHCRGSHDE